MQLTCDSTQHAARPFMRSTTDGITQHQCLQGVEQDGFGDLPDAGRDEIVARVSAADGLVALTGPLVRVAPAMLLEVRPAPAGA